MLYRMAFVGCLGLIAVTTQAQGHSCGPGCNGRDGGLSNDAMNGAFTPNAYQRDFRPRGYPSHSYRPYQPNSLATRMPSVGTMSQSPDPTMPPSLSGAYPSHSHGQRAHGRQRPGQGWTGSAQNQQAPRPPQSMMPSQRMETYNDFQPMMPPSLPPTTRTHQRMNRPQFDSLPERPVRMRQQPEMLHI